MTARFEDGTRVRRRVLGNVHVDRAERAERDQSELDEPVQTLIADSDRGAARAAGASTVTGTKNPMPADRDVFDYYVRTPDRLAPGTRSCAAGFGRHQLELDAWAASWGGRLRTGLENGARLDKTTLAHTNATPSSRRSTSTRRRPTDRRHRTGTCPTRLEKLTA